jgi:KUP system potassium uptake protein
MNISVKQKVTVATLLVALGIIYGDIGTSPLYVMKAIIGDRPINELLVYGGISCVFWTLTFQTTFKYILLTLSPITMEKVAFFRFMHWLKDLEKEN